MEKTPDDVLQQELLRERAEVLGRAGHSVERALTKLQHVEVSIEKKRHRLKHLGDNHQGHEGYDLSAKKRQIVMDINKEINHFNQLREHAKLRYHYLIVTREAMGLRKHHRVEEVYAIPPKKRQIQEN